MVVAMRLMAVLGFGFAGCTAYATLAEGVAYASSSSQSGERDVRSAASRIQRRCASRGSKTSPRSTRSVRVFSRPVRGGGRRYYACRYRAGKKYFLGFVGADAGGEVDLVVQVAGPFVAFTSGFESYGGGGRTDAFRVRDLRSGQITFSLTNPGLYSHISFVLKPNGSFAYLESGGDDPVDKLAIVDTVIKREGQQSTVLDQITFLGSARTPIDSLSLSGSIVSWRRDGQSFSAGLN